MPPVVIMVLRGLALRCPACGKGGIARSPFALREACPSCGAPIETRTGEATGGMAINLLATTILATVGVWWGAVFGTVPVVPLTAGLMVGAVAFSLAFHRHACGAWVGVLYATRDISEAPVRVQAGTGRSGAGAGRAGTGTPGARRMARESSAAARQSAPESQNAD